jgi:hypothetical protein
MGRAAVWASWAAACKAVADRRKRRGGVGGLRNLGRNHLWAGKGKEKGNLFFSETISSEKQLQ